MVFADAEAFAAYDAHPAPPGLRRDALGARGGGVRRARPRRRRPAGRLTARRPAQKRSRTFDEVAGSRARSKAASASAAGSSCVTTGSTRRLPSARASEDGVDLVDEPERPHELELARDRERDGDRLVAGREQADHHDPPAAGGAADGAAQAGRRPARLDHHVGLDRRDLVGLVGGQRAGGAEPTGDRPGQGVRVDHRDLRGAGPDEDRDHERADGTGPDHERAAARDRRRPGPPRARRRTPVRRAPPRRRPRPSGRGRSIRLGRVTYRTNAPSVCGKRAALPR